MGSFTSKSEKPQSLYERLGGATAIAAVVDGMYAKIFNDAELSEFFKKTDKERQKSMQRKFLTFATGGPSEYDGKSMADAHKGRGIKDKEFDIVCGHVVSTMKELGVSEALINETAALLLPLRPDCTN
jgi:hemoglobin